MNHVMLAAAHETVGDHEAAARSVADAPAINPQLTASLLARMMPMLQTRAPRLFVSIRAADLPPGSSRREQYPGRDDPPGANDR